MNAKSRLVVLGVLSLLAVALAPSLAGGFRSEDFLDFDWYSRHPFSSTLAGPHLGSQLVTFWRPLADACTWLVVRGIGPHPAAIHLLLVLLSVAAAWSVAAALRDLFGLRPEACVAAALLAVAQPFVPAVTTYLDGGLPLLLVAIATFQALAALGRWRSDAGGSVGVAPLLLWTLAAMLSHDGALLLVPVTIGLVALLLPPGARRGSWRPVALLLGMVPLLLVVRHLLIGKAFEGYATLAGPDLGAKLAAFPGRVLRCGARLFVPAFPGTLHGSSAALVGALVVGGVSAAAIVVALATRRGGGATLLRQGAAALVVVVGLLGMAPELFTLAAADASGRALVPDELTVAYRTYPAALAATLVLAWLVSLGRVALVAPLFVLFLWLRAPLAAAHDEALRWGRELPAAIAAVDAGAPTSRLLVLEVPVCNDQRAADGSKLAVTRAFQYGLASALRPPLVERERFAYPLFRVDDGMHDYFAQEAIDAFAACPWLTPLQCRLGAVADVVPVARPAVRASPLRLFASATADPKDAEPRFAPDLADVPIVEFYRYDYPDEHGAHQLLDVLELGASGVVPGVSTLLVLNRVAPFFVPLARREPGANGIDRVYFIQDVPQSPRWCREVAARFPDDVLFVALQIRPEPTASAPAPAVLVSNVLPIRLRERKGAP